MRVLSAIILAFSLFSQAFADSPAGSHIETDSKPTSFWMQKKMEYAQSILRGLASADFASISESAKQMRVLNRVEGFIRKRNPDYRTQLLTFERTCEQLVRQAKDENLEGVTLAFNQLTVSCVRCHQTLRSPEIHHSSVPNSQHSDRGAGDE